MRKSGWLGLLWVLAAGVPQAQPVDVPPALRDWQGWVLHGEEHRRCPLMLGQVFGARRGHLCAWPGRLRIDAGTEGARFSQGWTVHVESFVPLPGDGRLWPQGVTVDGQPAAVVWREQKPALLLGPGSHRIEGRIDWRRRPERLAVPDVIALIDLSVDGQRLAPAQRHGAELRLGAVPTEEAAPRPENTLELWVYRRIEDGVPQHLRTHIEIEVAGDAREIELGPVLPDGFIATSIESDLPVRIEADGRVRVQAVEGSHMLEIGARARNIVERVARVAAPAPWPEEEVWSFRGDPRIRVTVASGGEPIDPSLTGTPFDSNLPAYVMRGDDALDIEVRSRGLAAEEGNRLNLTRSMWLDHDGTGFYLRDRIEGRMRRDWRLDAAAPLRLQNVLLEGEPIQASLGPAPGLAGIELREQVLDIEAGLRLPRQLRLPVGGWQQSFDAVSVILHLPPGWKLVAAPGADIAPDTWAARWTLLDVFLVLIAVVLAMRLWGPGGALLMGAFLALAYHESGAPTGWLMAALVFALILRALGAGRLATTLRVCQALVLIVLAMVALPFLAAQVRMALHPQLESIIAPAVQQDSFRHPAPLILAEPPPPQGPMMQQARTSAPGEELERIEVTGSRIKRTDIERYEPGSILQAGQGQPDWSGPRHGLRWSGPVLADQDFQLLLAPPWLTRGLRWLMVLLLAALGWRLVVALRPRAAPPTAAAALFLAPLFLFSTSPVTAQDTPDPALLETLRERLLAASPCHPACANVAAADLVIDGDRFSLGMDVHALETVAVPLPLAEGVMQVARIVVDGVARDSLVRRGIGEYWLEVPRGVHRIEYAAAIDANRFSIPFRSAPRQLRVRAQGWRVVGMGDGRLIGDSLEFIRELTADAGEAETATLPESRFDPFVRVVRRVHIGLDVRVESSVHRIAPVRDGFTVRLPLLPDERVLSGGEHVDDGWIELAFDARTPEVEWRGSLPLAERIELVAPDLDGHAETWLFTVTGQWRPQFSGMPSVAPEHGSGNWVWEFHPLPGERLVLDLDRVRALPGDTLAIDRVEVLRSVGRRSAETRMLLDLRATQGNEWSIALPDGWELLALSMGGTDLALRPEAGTLTVPLKPGSQRLALSLREADAVGVMSRSAALDLGRPSINLRIEQRLPADRWVLWTSGPRTGPAVLYWGELLVMIALALALGRSGRTPLKTHHWLLLGLGFSMLSWLAPILVAGWLFAVDWRARSAGRMPWYAFNAMQVGLVLLTLIAVLALVAAISYGLLGTPDMHLTGNGSSPTILRWYADRSEGLLPQTTVLSLPLWVYKTAMLLWALWLANALIGWLRWTWTSWSGGGFWRRKPREAAVESAA